ncbi:diguanylate cyclase domain-containing protein [Methylobacterium tardum]|uniref:GGDEF domain-containing protein n=1 Tax=Methylobacterium tardum TaxID=374432 RepID=A0AA37TAY1_9HYPH|nr:hypothetical protein GCM10007890_19630 [Methylobacterium tardum]
MHKLGSRSGAGETADAFCKACGRVLRPALSSFAHRIAGAISQSVVICAGPAEINVSIGIALSAAHPQSSHDILTAADQAMYAAKRNASTPWRLATSREPRICAA